MNLTQVTASFLWRKVVPGKRVTLPAESTLASVDMRKKVEPFVLCKRFVKFFKEM